jgi:thiamine biosynthesis lipoprotein
MSKTSTDTPVRIALSGPTMGARWSAVFHGDPTDGHGDLRLALQAAVDEVDRQMSTYRRSSDLNRLNAAPVGVWIDLPAETVAVIEAALAIGEASGGAFDIGVGELVAAWGFGADARSEVLGGVVPQGLAFRSLELDAAGRRARKWSEMRLDLSGIAKGYGVDRLGETMMTFGHASWLVGIDGEMLARGRKPDGGAWAVGHERPAVGERRLMGVLELEDVAVATSGGYRHRRDVAGRMVSHTMDPRSGEPLDNGVAAVTVLAGTCMAADAWATALLVGGLDEGVALARRLGISALFVDGEDRVVSTLAARGRVARGTEQRSVSQARAAVLRCGTAASVRVAFVLRAKKRPIRYRRFTVARRGAGVFPRARRDIRKKSAQEELRNTSGTAIFCSWFVPNRREVAKAGR